MITSTFSMWHVLAIVLAVGFAVLFFYLAKLLIQVQQTLKTVEKTLTDIKGEFQPVIENVEGITGNVEQMTGRVDEIFKDVKDKTEDTMITVDNIKNKVEISQDIIKHTFYLFLSRSAKYSKALSTGLKVGVGNFKENKFSPESKELLNSSGSAKSLMLIDHLEVKAKWNKRRFNLYF